MNNIINRDKQTNYINYYIALSYKLHKLLCSFSYI